MMMVMIWGVCITIGEAGIPDKVDDMQSNDFSAANADKGEEAALALSRQREHGNSATNANLDDHHKTKEASHPLR